MGRAFAIIVLFVGLIALPPAATADAFLSVIDDLPLMSDLTEDSETAVSFETADGRIAKATAAGSVSPGSVEAFYLSVLPQIGWTEYSSGVYRRNHEELRIDVRDDGRGGVSVDFSLRPSAD